MRTSLLLLSLIALGCSATASEKAVRTQYAYENKVPGTVNEPWVAPMIDTVEVPGQLDPTGTYYRLPHKAIYEIRHGKFTPVQYPSSDEAGE